MTQYGVVLFHTTSAALRAEKLVKQAGLVCKLIPVPRELSSDCGISLRFAWEQAEAVQQLLRDAGVDMADVQPLGGP
jgi:hypothetical protein